MAAIRLALNVAGFVVLLKALRGAAIFVKEMTRTI